MENSSLSGPEMIGCGGDDGGGCDWRDEICASCPRVDQCEVCGISGIALPVSVFLLRQVD